MSRKGRFTNRQRRLHVPSRLLEVDYAIDELSEHSETSPAIPSVVQCDTRNQYGNRSRNRNASRQRNCDLLGDSNHTSLTLDSTLCSTITESCFSSNSSITTKSTLDSNPAMFANGYGGNKPCIVSFHPPSVIRSPSPATGRHNGRASIRQSRQPTHPGSTIRKTKQKVHPASNKQYNQYNNPRYGNAPTPTRFKKKQPGLLDNRFSDTSHNQDDNKLMSLQLKALKQQLKRTEAILMQTSAGTPDTNRSVRKPASATNQVPMQKPCRRASMSSTASSHTNTIRKPNRRSSMTSTTQTPTVQANNVRKTNRRSSMSSTTQAPSVHPSDDERKPHRRSSMSSTTPTFPIHPSDEVCRPHRRSSMTSVTQTPSTYGVDEGRKPSRRSSMTCITPATYGGDDGRKHHRRSSMGNRAEFDISWQQLEELRRELNESEEKLINVMSHFDSDRPTSLKIHPAECWE